MTASGTRAIQVATRDAAQPGPMTVPAGAQAWRCLPV